MIVRPMAFPGVLVAFLACTASQACAAGSVQLEIVSAEAGASLSFQQWNEALGKAGIRDFRIRNSDGSEKLGIETGGTPNAPVYIVTVAINAQDELVTPGGRFRRSDAGKLAQWLRDLAANGPAEKRPATGVFGLTAEQFLAVHDDLAALVNFSTKGMSRAEAIDRIRTNLKTPLRIAPADAAALKEGVMDDELQGLASGTALACILRPAGYCLVPRGGKVELAVVASQPKLEIWPIGWEPKQGVREALPAINEFLNINVQNAAIGDAVKAIGERLKAPVLLDHNAIARHGIDMTQAVTLPGGRTTYSLALRKALFQAKLKFEVRVDEADQPFLWISSVKPM